MEVHVRRDVPAVEQTIARIGASRLMRQEAGDGEMAQILCDSSSSAELDGHPTLMSWARRRAGLACARVGQAAAAGPANLWRLAGAGTPACSPPTWSARASKERSRRQCKVRCGSLYPPVAIRAPHCPSFAQLACRHRHAEPLDHLPAPPGGQRADPALVTTVPRVHRMKVEAMVRGYPSKAKFADDPHSSFVWTSPLAEPEAERSPSTCRRTARQSRSQARSPDAAPLNRVSLDVCARKQDVSRSGVNEQTPPEDVKGGEANVDDDTPKQLLALRAALLEKLGTRSRVFRELDINGNGTVGYSELANGLERLKIPVMEICEGRDLQWIFRVCDVDKSGTLDIDEFLGAPSKVRRRPEVLPPQPPPWQAGLTLVLTSCVSPETTRAELMDVFEAFGVVLEIELPPPQTRSSEPTTVRFSDHRGLQAAEQACLAGQVRLKDGDRVRAESKATRGAVAAQIAAPIHTAGVSRYWPAVDTGSHGANPAASRACEQHKGPMQSGGAVEIQETHDTESAGFQAVYQHVADFDKKIAHRHLASSTRATALDHGDSACSACCTSPGVLCHCSSGVHVEQRSHQPATTKFHEALTQLGTMSDLQTHSVRQLHEFALTERALHTSRQHSDLVQQQKVSEFEVAKMHVQQVSVERLTESLQASIETFSDSTRASGKCLAKHVKPAQIGESALDTMFLFTQQEHRGHNVDVPGPKLSKEANLHVPEGMQLLSVHTKHERDCEGRIMASGHSILDSVVLALGADHPAVAQDSDRHGLRH